MTRKSKVYIIFGASGSGKTTLLHEISNSDIPFSIHTKGTTRKSRQYDGKELISIDEKSISCYQYVYERYGYLYGIEKAQIEDAINRKLNHFIVCNDIKSINDIKKDFGDKIRVIFISYNAPEKILREIQETRNINDDEINLRLQKMDSLYNDFFDNRCLFNHVINNIFGSPPSSMLNQLRGIIGNDNDMSGFHFNEIQDQLLNLTNKFSDLEKSILNSNEVIEAQIDPGFVFIIMAMTEKIPKLLDYKNAYQRTFQKVKMRANRIDDFDFQNEITEKILSSIRAAEIIIVDLTLNRPNVFYELGYAKAFNKEIIICAEKGNIEEFDVRNYQRIEYVSATDLEEKLEMKLKRIFKKRELINCIGQVEKL